MLHIWTCSRQYWKTSSLRREKLTHVQFSTIPPFTIFWTNRAWVVQRHVSKSTLCNHSLPYWSYSIDQPQDQPPCPFQTHDTSAATLKGASWIQDNACITRYYMMNSDRCFYSWWRQNTGLNISKLIHNTDSELFCIYVTVVVVATNRLCKQVIKQQKNCIQGLASVLQVKPHAKTQLP